MTSSRLLGVDGGGTSTTAWLADLEGVVLGRGVAGPSNIKAIGADKARGHLDQAIEAAFFDADEPVRPAAVACLGLAGFDRPEDRRWLEDRAASASWADRVILVNDGDLVVAAGTPEGWGIGLIAGTGSIAVGRSVDGRSARAGGWGHLIGDEGSAYAVALAGLRKVAHQADGRASAEPSGLTSRICDRLQIRTTAELVTTVYGPGYDRARLASLAPAVVLAADDDPSIFTEILEPAGEALARMVLAVARTLQVEPGPLPLAMAGSFLLNCGIVKQVVLERLTNQGFAVSAFEVPDPVAGALVLAHKGLDS